MAESPAATSSSSSGLDVKVKKSQLDRAVRAIAQIVEKKSATNNALFDNNSPTMSVIFTLSQIPEKARFKPILIPLPHPLHDEKSEVCFFSKSPQKKYKELLLQQHPVPGLTKVIGIEKLQKNYRQPADKRALVDAFDLFLCDRDILEMMRKVLGSVFYTKKLKKPVPVVLNEKDPRPAIEKTMRATVMRLPAGPCVSVKVGRCNTPVDQLVANATVVVASVVKELKGNLVSSISVKATDSPSLPVWKRPQTPGELLNFKKYNSDAASSAASATGTSGTSGTSDIEIGDSDIPSDAGETLSTMDTISEVGTLSEVETAGDTLSELDSQAGDIDESLAAGKDSMPLVQGLKKKKKRRRGGSEIAEQATSKGASVESEPVKTVSDSGSMPPPAKKTKKAKS